MRALLLALVHNGRAALVGGRVPRTTASAAALFVRSSSSYEPGEHKSPAYRPRPGWKGRRPTQPVDDDGNALPRPELTIEAAKLSAVRLVHFKPRSMAEIQASLLERGASAVTAETVSAWLVSQGMQSDALLASSVARGKWRAGKWAPARIRRELSMRGLGAHADAALVEVFGPTGDLSGGVKDLFNDDFTEGEADETKAGRVDETAAESLLATADRRWLSMGPRVDALTKRRRLTGWLLRRGHGYDTVAALIKQIEASHAAA